LLGLLGDPNAYVRREAVRALASREGPGIAEALLGLLGDPDAYVRRKAADALGDREITQLLIDWVKENPKACQVDLSLVTRLAERLMNRSYRRIDSFEQQSLRSEMAWLTELA
jgi:HEAT repeat protein